MYPIRVFRLTSRQPISRPVPPDGAFHLPRRVPAQPFEDCGIVRLDPAGTVNTGDATDRQLTAPNKLIPRVGSDSATENRLRSDYSAGGDDRGSESCRDEYRSLS